MAYKEFVCSQIAELRLQKNVSEHWVCLALDKRPSHNQAPDRFRTVFLSGAYNLLLSFVFKGE